jgi:Ca2+-binding EF-hand superfamily protein
MPVAEELRVVIKAEVADAIKNLKGYQQSAKETESAIKKFGQQVTSMAAGWFTVQAAVALARKAMKEFNEMSELAANAEELRSSLESMAERAGVDFESMLTGLKQASRGTISEFNLMQAASRASVLGIGLDQLPKLMDIARASAKALGGTTSQMFEDIITGTGRASAMILDNLGIRATGATEQFAKALGKTVSELTAEEKTQAILNAVLSDGDRIMEQLGDHTKEFTSKDKYEAAKAALEDIRSELGEQLLPIWTKLAELRTNWIKNLVKDFTFGDLFKGIQKNGIASLTDSLGKAENAVAVLKEELAQYESSNFFGIHDKTIKEYVKNIALLESKIWGMKQDQTKITEEQKQAAEAAEKRAKQEAYNAKVAEVWGRTEQGKTEELRRQLEYWQGALTTAGASKEKVEDIIAYLQEQIDQGADINANAQVTLGLYAEQQAVLATTGGLLLSGSQTVRDIVASNQSQLILAKEYASTLPGRLEAAEKEAIAAGTLVEDLQSQYDLARSSLETQQEIVSEIESQISQHETARDRAQEELDVARSLYGAGSDQARQAAEKLASENITLQTLRDQRDAASAQLTTLEGQAAAAGDNLSKASAIRDARRDDLAQAQAALPLLNNVKDIDQARLEILDAQLGPMTSQAELLSASAQSGLDLSDAAQKAGEKFSDVKGSLAAMYEKGALTNEEVNKILEGMQNMSAPAAAVSSALVTMAEKGSITKDEFVGMLSDVKEMSPLASDIAGSLVTMAEKGIISTDQMTEWVTKLGDAKRLANDLAGNLGEVVDAFSDTLVKTNDIGTALESALATSIDTIREALVAALLTQAVMEAFKLNIVGAVGLLGLAIAVDVGGRYVSQGLKAKVDEALKTAGAGTISIPEPPAAPPPVPPPAELPPVTQPPAAPPPAEPPAAAAIPEEILNIPGNNGGAQWKSLAEYQAYMRSVWGTLESTGLQWWQRLNPDATEEAARNAGWLPFAEGGIVTGPTQALIGEAGPEAVIPLDELGPTSRKTTIVNQVVFTGPVSDRKAFESIALSAMRKAQRGY